MLKVEADDKSAAYHAEDRMWFRLLIGNAMKMDAGKTAR